MTMRLTLEREKRGLSKAELARRAHMQATDLGKIESGRHKAYESQLRKLGRAMRMRKAEWLRLTEDVVTLESALQQVEDAGESADALQAAFAAFGQTGFTLRDIGTLATRARGE